ncbi:MAG TPA: MarR family winged helix-turn-helix transcriptional regulator [Candidatus Acidoferrales bacterium]|nr:MarR family winged helix-turn-helix transcriptional regulator [Candidatus Acidoferrales bacterium]
MRVYTRIMTRQGRKFDLLTCSRIGATCSLFHLRKAARVVTQIYDDVFKDSGIRGTQFALLAGIYWSGTATLTELGKLLAMDRTTLTRNFGPLRKRGLIGTVRSADRRARAVALTPRGHAALAKALPYWAKAQNRVVSGLGEKKWRKLMAGLADMVRLGAEK